MSKGVINDIHQYMRFLEKCGYDISFSFIRHHFAPVIHEIMQYDFHPHAVCNYLKQNPKTAGKCALNKCKLEKKEITKPFYGSCYAGVEEFLFPVYYEDIMLLCIHVSGFRGKLKHSHEAMEKTAALCTEQFHTLYSELSGDVPTIEQISSFIKPLQYMLLELYKNCCGKGDKAIIPSSSGELYVKALRFIHENYSQPINADILAKEIGYSASYLRYIFKVEGNTSVQSKINEIRLHNAKRLLRGTTMNVTEIAFLVGFADSNYFSSFFKKHEKISPKEYRKRLLRD